MERYEVKEMDSGFFCVMDNERFTILDGPFSLQTVADDYAMYANTRADMKEAPLTYVQYLEFNKSMADTSQIEAMDATCKRFSVYERRLSELRGASQKAELAMSEARDEAAHYKACIAYLTALLTNDSYAMTFQSMGQYRSALMTALENVVADETDD